MSERTITQRDLAKALVRAEDKNFNESSIMALAFPPLEPREFNIYPNVGTGFDRVFEVINEVEHDLECGDWDDQGIRVREIS